jgi:hypothetical protein
LRFDREGRDKNFGAKTAKLPNGAAANFATNSYREVIMTNQTLPLMGKTLTINSQSGDLQRLHHSGGQTLGALAYFQLHILTFPQGTKAVRLNDGVMDKDIALVGLDETETLGVIEPSDLTLNHANISFIIALPIASSAPARRRKPLGFSPVARYFKGSPIKSQGI